MGLLHNQESWAFAFGILGNIISVMVYLAPVPTFIRIYKKKSTESFQSLPYQVALFSSMLWLYYALLKSNAFLLITINCFGCVVETIYIALFFTYANRESRKSALKLFSGLNMGVFSIILVMTQFLVKDPENRVDVLGWVCVAVSVAVFAAPLSIVARVVRTKSVEFMPVTLSIFLTISAVMWFAYGMFIKDLCVALPNVLGFFLGMVQIVLYGIYKKKENALPSKKKPAPENLKTVVVMGDLGVTETYPVDLEKKNCRTEHLETEKTEEVPEKCAVTAVPAPEPVAVPCAVQMVECAV